MSAPESKLFTIRLPIRFTHTDPAGQVFFPRYFEMFQAAVEDWFTYGLGVNYAKLIAEGYGLPTARTECVFSRPSRLGEALDLTIHATHVGRSSLAIDYIGKVAGEERLRASSVLVLIKLGEGKSVAFPDDLRARLLGYARLTGENGSS